MIRSKSCVSILLVLAFLAGIVAPVPECFVTRLVCPLKKSIACKATPSKSAPGPSLLTSCCAKTAIPLDSHFKWTMADLRHWMKPYAPERETVKSPVLPASLLPSLFHKPVSPDTLVFFMGIAQRCNLPDPIPILQRKQSFLI